MVRKIAVGTATSRRLRLHTRSQYSNRSRIRKTGIGPNSGRRMRHRRTSRNIARPCSSSPHRSSAYHLYHIRRQANIALPLYNRQRQNQTRIRKWLYQLVRRPTSSLRHDLPMHPPRHFLPTSQSCYSRRQTSTLLLHAAWGLC
jgi:hypothetical protein